MKYHALGNTIGNGAYVQLIPGRPTSFLTLNLWRLRIKFMWRSR